VRLYLVRHGEAVSDAIDDRRPLSERGIEEIRKMTRFLQDSCAEVEVIYHSTKLRARQTAEIFQSGLQVKKDLIEKAGLAPNDPVAPIADFLEGQKGGVMVVGHMPFMGALISLLVTGEDNKNLVGLPTGGIAILEKKHGGPWLISAMIDPKML